MVEAITMPWLVTTGTSLVSVFVFVTLFLWLSLAIGRRILRLLGAAGGEASLTERGVLAAALGIGALQFVPFFLGATGLLGRTSLRLAIGGVALAASYDLWQVARRFRELVRASVPRGWLRVWAACLLPGLAVAALLALTPTIDPDGLGYHLVVPKRWLESGRLGYLPTYAYSNTPMGVEMIFMIALAFVGDAGAKMLHFSMAALGAVGVYFSGQRLASKSVGAVAASLYLFGPAGVVSLMGLAYVEGASSFATIASTLAWLIWFRGRNVAWLRAAALLAAIGVSFKITAALFPIALGALTVLALFSDREKSAVALAPKTIAGLLLLLAAPLVPWFARSALLTGNPVFPLFAQWIPSRDLSPALARRFEEYNRYMLWGSRIGLDWTLGQRRLILVACAGVLVIVTLLVRTRLRGFMARSCALVMLAMVVVQLGAVGLYLRYWIPALAVLQLPVLAALGPWFDRRPARTAIVALTGVLSLFHVRQMLKTVQTSPSGLLLTVLGVEEQRTFLMHNIPLFPLYEHVNHRLPSEARIMLSTYCGAFYIDRTTYCSEFVTDSLRFTSWLDFVSDVPRLGVTHVIAPTRLANGDVSAPKEGGSVSVMFRANQNQFVGRLLRERGTILSAAGDQALYQLDLKGLR